MLLILNCEKNLFNTFFNFISPKMISTTRGILRREVGLRLITNKILKKPIISCKRPELDHYEGQTYEKFKGMKLASQSWLHHKSKGDYFTIHLDANKDASRTLEEEQTHSNTFQDTGLCAAIVEVVERQGFAKPTSIQVKAIPSLLAGNNTVITAETGCGKTLAYLLPIFQNMLEWKQHISEERFNSPSVVVIAPSRELTKQIGHVATELGKCFDMNVTTLIGGHTKRKIVNPPIEYCDMIVTTLGAFSKLVTSGIYKINNVHHVVLDEADTLLDDSFKDKLIYLMKKFQIQYRTTPTVPPQGCQLTLVSATMPFELPEQVNGFVEPESLKVITTSKIHRIQSHVPQKFLRLGKAQKPLEVLKLATADSNAKRPVMIFSNKSDTCDWLSMFLNESGLKCINLNGRMNSSLQLGLFEEYRTGRADILSCTDIASRGLDTTRTKHIINYDFPLYTADYIHRCGRTGRLGGPQHCFVTNFIAWPREIALVQKIETTVRREQDLPSVNANINRLIQERINNMLIKDLRRIQKN